MMKYVCVFKTYFLTTRVPEVLQAGLAISPMISCGSFGKALELD